MLVLLTLTGCVQAQMTAEPEKKKNPAKETIHFIVKDKHPKISTTPVRPEEPGFVIYAWGDSITAGINGDGTTYPSVLEEMTGITVKNFGVPGETSQEIVSRCVEYGRHPDDVLVIQMGDNGGWRDIDDLVSQYRRMIRASGSERYIIMTSTDDPDDFDQIWGYTKDYIGLKETPYEKALKEAFGEHVFEARQYLIVNGLAINGITETYEDRLRARQGSISEKLRNEELDNTHLNAYGYRAMAWGIFELGAKLGYWS